MDKRRLQQLLAGLRTKLASAPLAGELSRPLPHTDLPEAASQFLSQANLMGSRGRATMYGRPEPDGRDYDYIAFTDDSEQQSRLLQLLQRLNKENGYRLIPRENGFMTAQGNNMDLSVYPAHRRNLILRAWELQEGGMSKDESWVQVNREQTQKVASVLRSLLDR